MSETSLNWLKLVYITLQIRDHTGELYSYLGLTYTIKAYRRIQTFLVDNVRNIW